MIYYEEQILNEAKKLGLDPDEIITRRAQKNNKTREELLYLMANRLIAKFKYRNKPMNTHDFSSLISYYEEIMRCHNEGKADCSDFISAVYCDAANSFLMQDMLAMNKQEAKNYPMKFVHGEKIFQYNAKAIELKHNNYLALSNIITFCFQNGDFSNARKFLNCFLDEWDMAKIEEKRSEYYQKVLTITFDFLTMDENVFGLPLQNKDFVLLCNQDKINIYEALLDFYKNRFWIFNNANIVTVNAKEFTLFNILGKLYEYSGEYHKAYSLYKNWITITPNIYIPYVELSLISLRFNSLKGGKKAEDFASAGLQQLENVKNTMNKEKYEDAYYSLKNNLSAGLILQEKLDEAERIIKNLLINHGRMMSKEQLNSCYHHLGLLYFKMKKYDKAELFVREAVKIYDDETSYELLGDVLMQRNMKKDALVNYQKAYAFACNYLENKKTNFTISSVLYDEKERVKELLKKIIKTSLENNEIVFARKYLDEANKLYPNDADFIEIEVECIKEV